MRYGDDQTTAPKIAMLTFCRLDITWTILITWTRFQDLAANVATRTTPLLPDFIHTKTPPTTHR